MAYLSDIEIAQRCKPEHIGVIAKRAHVDEKYIEQYGNYKAKIDLSLLSETKRENGKLILVTAITPTPAGEGKTTTTIGLADGLRRIGKSRASARFSESRAEPPAADMRRWFPWRISTSTSPATSTR